MRKRKLALNTVTAILNQVVALICGFILPRQILLHFGSDVNGLVSSITQFLGFISLMDMGVGAVVQAELYKPLAETDDKKISEIVFAANVFFRRIAYCLVAYTIALMVMYPTIIDRSFGYLSTGFLVMAIAIRSVAEYYFGITNKLLLSADQKSYVYLIPTTITNVLNNLVAVGLIQLGCSITTVKLVSSLVLMLCPLYMAIYVKRNYRISKKVRVEGKTLNQKWSALSQHIATFIVDRTDVVVLTLMSTLANVSIYNVYHLIVYGLYQTYAVITTGIQSLFGDMYAKGEKEKLLSTFEFIEWVTHFFVSLIFGCTSVLIIPFVKVYTKGVTDANYAVPSFAFLITAAYGFCCLFIFYNMMIKAAGHFRQTKNSAIIEAILNLVISIALVRKYGLVGVAIGTLIAKVYRVLYFNLYLKNSILNREIVHFLKQIFIDALCVIVIFFSTKSFSLVNETYWGWILLSLKTGMISLGEVIVVNYILNKKFFRVGFGLVKRK